MSARLSAARAGRLFQLVLVLSALGIGMIVGKVWALAEVEAARKRAAAPSVVACVPRQDQDRACVAWLFETDLGKARDRICGGRR
jgi:hypothetical protein